MDIRFLNQPKDGCLGDILKEHLESGAFSRVWLFAGFAKDTGLDFLLGSIQKARESGAMVECVLGLDKKNTSKDMLLKLLNLGCKIRFHLNDDDKKLETRVYAFESDDSESYVYLTGAKLSEGGLTTNLSLITELVYSRGEKKEFNRFKANMENGISMEDFHTLNEDILKELASTGEILARITERKIPSIRELYQTGDVEVGVQEYDESTSVNYNEIAKKDFDIAIDFPEIENPITVQSSLGEEVEHKIKSSILREPENTVVSKIVVNEKDVNYDTMSALILPINKVVKKGVTAGEIKVPTSIASRMHVFLNYPVGFHIETDVKGKLREVQKVNLVIFENMTKREVTDSEALLIQNEKNLVIKSEMFSDFTIEENDVMRLIKVENASYRCEIIKQESSEYNIWENFCTLTTRGTSKKFGIS